DIVYEKFEIIPDIRKDHVVLPIGKRPIGRSFDILIEDNFLFTATVGKKGSVQLNKNLDMADEIMNAMKEDARIIAKVRD
ncbi:MAG: ATPase, partial [Methanobrevibacter sp.]|nr:ATPase [Methanobrevibacter sp.]